MPRSGIEHIDLTGGERAQLHEIAYGETTALLDGRNLYAEDIGREPWERVREGVNLGAFTLASQEEEHRLRCDHIADLVVLLDVIGWTRGADPTRLFLYPAVIRALRYFQAVCDRLYREHGDEREAGGRRLTEKELLDNLMAVANGD